MRMTTITTALASLLCIAGVGTAQADVIGFAAGAGVWQQGYSGTASDEDHDEFDVEDDLDLDSSTGTYVWAALEHPIPLLPNVRLERTGISTDGTGRIDRSFTFDDSTFAADERVDSTLELDQTDFILYYELLDNYLSVDAGVNVRFIDGLVRIERENGDRAKRGFSGALPLIYGNARVWFPTTDVWVGAEGSGLSYSGNKVLDLRVAAGYEFGFGLGVEAGYRRQSLTLDDIDNVSADVDVDGPYLGAYLDF